MSQAIMNLERMSTYMRVGNEDQNTIREPRNIAMYVRSATEEKTAKEVQKYNMNKFISKKFLNHNSEMIVFDGKEGMKELLSLAKNHTFDTLVVFRADRISRKELELYGILKQLHEFGVEVYESSTGRLLK